VIGESRESLATRVATEARHELAGPPSTAFNRDVWRRCAALGVLGLPVPLDYGGSHGDPLAAVHVLEALGQVCRDNGLLFALGAQMWSVEMPILRFGTAEQKATYLPRLCSGEWIGAHAMTEPGSGSDAFALVTRAVRRGADFVLTGSKTFVTLAPVADVFVVFAATGPTAGPLGLSAFLVARDTPGLHVGPVIPTMGLASAPLATLVMDDCIVPAAQVLGREGRGADVFSDSMEWERSCILAGAVGTMRRLVEECVPLAKRRASPDGVDFPSTTDSLAEMQVQLETARLVLYHAARAKALGEEAAMTSAIAKLVISRAFVSVANSAMRVHAVGSPGAHVDSQAVLHDALASTLYSGTEAMQLRVIARGFGVNPS
jgi:alkylation response protein AidB-like acyl-CoA dehydrogenase